MKNLKMRKNIEKQKKKKTGIAEIILVLLLTCGGSAVAGEDLSIRGSLHSEYWVYREDYGENFEAKIEINLSYKSFVGKLGYFTWEPSQQGVSIRYPIFSVGYSESPLDVVVGHYYATFGRGLVLREYLDRDFKHDKYLTGLKLTADLSPVSLTLLSGRPKNILFEGDAYEILNDTTDLLRGADIRFSPKKRLSFGGSYLRFTSESDIAPCAFTELIGGNLSCSIGDWDSYLEYAQQLKCSATRGRIKGEGVYFSVSGGLGGVGLSAQYANYEDLAAGGSGYRYNDPPTPLRSGLSINRGYDESGGSAMISASPSPSVYFEAEYGFLENHDQSQWAGEWYGNLKYDVMESLSLSFGIERANEKQIEPSVKGKLQTTPTAEVCYYLLSGHGIELRFSQGFIEQEFWLGSSDTWETVEYVDRSFVISYSRLPLFSASIRTELLSEEIEILSPKTFWPSAEFAVDVRPNLNLRLIAGSTKGGLVCSGGVCRIEPDFEGIKATLSYIF